jgi:hypothetical protein
MPGNAARGRHGRGNWVVMKVRRIRLRIRRFFVKTQVGLASAMLLGAVISAVTRSWPSLEAGLFAWGVLAVALFAGQVILTIPVVQKFFYYRLWVGMLLGGVLRLTGGVEGFTRDVVRPSRLRFRWLLAMFDLPYEKWVRESAHWEPPVAQEFPYTPHPPGAPVFVQRDHLVGSYRWPGQSFATATLFNPVRISRAGDSGYELSVDLTDEAYGIYKNRGKQFLNRMLLRMREEVTRTEILDRSSQVHRFLMEADGDTEGITAGGPNQPLRWSSAGALPLVHWRKPGQSSSDDWFVLFFRGISPVGWNLASGSSESAREWRYLFEVGVRELCEELVVLEGPPVRQGRPEPEIYRRRFRLDQPVNAYPELVRRLTGREFVAGHDQLRERQDQITIIDDPSREVLHLHPLDTKFSVRVTEDGESFSTENVVFAVNPLEAGIESIFIFRFELGDSDYLIFGEVLEDLDALAREPVMLLRRSFVESQIARYGSLGELLPDQERKRLRSVPATDYHIFDADITLRERRLRNMLSDLGIAAGETITSQQAASLRDGDIRRLLATARGPGRKRALLEARFHANWLANYAAQFNALNPESPLEAHTTDGEPLLLLCAVTWKTLELVCRHKIAT